MTYQKELFDSIFPIPASLCEDSNRVTPTTKVPMETVHLPPENHDFTSHPSQTHSRLLPKNLCANKQQRLCLNGRKCGSFFLILTRSRNVCVLNTQPGAHIPLQPPPGNPEEKQSSGRLSGGRGSGPQTHSPSWTELRSGSSAQGLSIQVTTGKATLPSTA